MALRAFAAEPPSAPHRRADGFLQRNALTSDVDARVTAADSDNLTPPHERRWRECDCGGGGDWVSSRVFVVVCRSPPFTADENSRRIDSPRRSNGTRIYTSSVGKKVAGCGLLVL